MICTQFWVLQQVPPDQGNNVGISHGESIVYDGMWVLLSEDCSWVGGGPGSGGHGIGTGGGTGSGGNGTGTGGGGSNNGGGSGSGNNNTAIITTPIGKTPNNPNPCAPLAELFDEDKQNLSHYIDELVALHQQSTENEVSYSFSKKKIGWDEDNNRYIFSNYQALYTLGSTTSVKTQIGYATDGQIYYSCIHLHPKQEGPAASIFSWGDIKLLRDLYLSLKDVMYVAESNDISLMVVAPDPQNIHNHNVYAVTVKNYTNLVNALKLEDDKWKNRFPDERDRKTAINEHFGDKYVENKDTLEAYFLDAFSNYGISLFKLENNQWKELLLSSDRQNVIKKPCN